MKTVGVSMLNFVRANLDYLVIGRSMGAVQLGQYTMAYKIADFPRARIATVFTGVAFPALSSVRADGARFRHVYLRGVKLVSILIVPLLVGAAVLTRELVVLVYGDKWLPAVYPARVLLLMGIFLVVGEVSTTALIAMGRAGVQLVLSAVYTVTLAALVFPALEYGINGVAVAVFMATAAYFAVLVVRANHVIGVSASAYVRSLAPALSGSALIVISLIVAGRLVVDLWGASDVVWIACATALSGLAYYIGVGRAGRAELRDALHSLVGPVLGRYRARRSHVDSPDVDGAAARRETDS